MSSIDILENLTNTQLINYDLKYCLVTKDKLPKKITGEMAKPNKVDDFVSFSDLLLCENLDEYQGVGISIQASSICAIDVDHCFQNPKDINSGDERSKQILEMFKDNYCEFSFSGTGLRILFLSNLISNLSDKYYIKNSKTQCEYYQPLNSYRYVTLTGNYIYNNEIKFVEDSKLKEFLDKFMLKPEKKKREVISNYNTLSKEEIFKKVRILYFKNSRVQDLWFGQAPGSGKNESELDYELLVNLYEQITDDEDLLKEIFESSNYFKSKDYKHKKKWENQNNRYYHYIYEQIRRSH